LIGQGKEMGVFSFENQNSGLRLNERRTHPCSNNWISASTV
jgi:hypothetical protein